MLDRRPLMGGPVSVVHTRCDSGHNVEAVCLAA
jgi:hypothetical protein